MITFCRRILERSRRRPIGAAAVVSGALTVLAARWALASPHLFRDAVLVLACDVSLSLAFIDGHIYGYSGQAAEPRVQDATRGVLERAIGHRGSLRVPSAWRIGDARQANRKIAG
jgi:hypothetical protein